MISTVDQNNEGTVTADPEKVRPAAPQIADPLFILAAPRSFSSVVCGMLGGHPQMHGLPETHLFIEERMDGWFARASQETYSMDHGLLRSVAQLCYGQQTDETIKTAAAWLSRRRSSTSGMIFEELARRVSPAILVEKSPSMVYTPESMRRAHRFFPLAKFIHLVRHPMGQGRSVMKYRELLAQLEFRSSKDWTMNSKEGDAPAESAPEWINNLASFPYLPAVPEAEYDSSKVDPQRGWYVLNKNIIDFLSAVPGNQRMTVRGEDLLTDPEPELVKITEWLGIRDDNDAIERMKHPENSPYACFGPARARRGNDILYLRSPRLRLTRANPQTLEETLPWRSDGLGFLHEVKELAHFLGYQ